MIINYLTHVKISINNEKNYFGLVVQNERIINHVKRCISNKLYGGANNNELPNSNTNNQEFFDLEKQQLFDKLKDSLNKKFGESHKKEYEKIEKELNNMKKNLETLFQANSMIKSLVETLNEKTNENVDANTIKTQLEELNKILKNYLI